MGSGSVEWSSSKRKLDRWLYERVGSSPELDVAAMCGESPSEERSNFSKKAISRRESSVRFVGGKKGGRKTMKRGKQREEEKGYNDLFCFLKKKTK